jgi:hypothetical protein
MAAPGISLLSGDVSVAEGVSLLESHPKQKLITVRNRRKIFMCSI